MHIPWIVIFLEFINKDENLNVNYSPSAAFILHYFANLAFFGEKCTLPIFWRINRTPIPFPFVKGEFENVSFTKLPKNINN